RSFVKIFSSVMIVVLLTTAFGCYGSFQLINKVYKFNGGLGDKFVNELGFLVMVIIPVYGVAGFVDAVILNTIEFWTGKNPMAQNDGTRTIPLPDGNLTMRNADGSYEFSQVLNGKEECVRVETRDGITTSRDRSGNVLAMTVRNADGGVTVYDASGDIVSLLSKTQVESMVAAK
ncbi:MAG TPA: DUF3332 domain-containing protein, partial [Bacteroidota bacterium]